MLRRWTSREKKKSWGTIMPLEIRQAAFKPRCAKTAKVKVTGLDRLGQRSTTSSTSWSTEAMSPSSKTSRCYPPPSRSSPSPKTYWKNSSTKKEATTPVHYVFGPSKTYWPGRYPSTWARRTSTSAEAGLRLSSCLHRSVYTSSRW